jgi:hypothetical protein
MSPRLPWPEKQCLTEEHFSGWGLVPVLQGRGREIKSGFLWGSFDGRLKGRSWHLNPELQGPCAKWELSCGPSSGPSPSTGNESWTLQETLRALVTPGPTETCLLHFHKTKCPAVEWAWFPWNQQVWSSLRKCVLWHLQVAARRGEREIGSAEQVKCTECAHPLHLPE